MFQRGWPTLDMEWLNESLKHDAALFRKLRSLANGELEIARQKK